MAWSGSGLYVATFQDVLDTTQLALNLDLETHKMALFSDSITPNFSTDTSYSSTGEISGTGYTAGGTEITGTALSISNGVLSWDSDNIEWEGTTLSGVRGGIAYADALMADNLIVGIDFGEEYNTSDGTFLLVPHADGIFAIDMVP